jgi:iron(III) transport system permease protein
VALLGTLMGLLGVFVLYPVAAVMKVALVEDGHLTGVHLAGFLARDLFREALWNSLLAGAIAVVAGSAIALPLAILLTRYDFPGRSLVRTLGVLPLVVPPFIGAVALQLVLGRSGVVNLLLLRWCGQTLPFMEGLHGVVLVQSLHFFPFILLNVCAALENVDHSLEEAAQSLGARGLGLWRRVTLPLLMPGFVAGALLVFIKTVDDLGTPLMLNYTRMLAPQAYLRITNIGGDDRTGYVIAVIMVLLSWVALWAAMRYLSKTEYTTGRSGTRAARRPLAGWRLAGAGAFCAVTLGLALLPQLGIVVLSFAKTWSFTLLPQAWTLDHYREVLLRTPHFVRNTLVYCLLAAVLDVILGALVAFLRVRGSGRGRGLLDGLASLPLAVPGVVLGIGYLRAFHDWQVPWLGTPLTSTWLILVLAYAARRLPYTVRSCHAALQQVHISLEEAAQSLGCPAWRTFLRITLPLMSGGLVAGGIVAFITSAVELSSTMMLVPHNDQGPLSFGIYLYMQSAVGRGPGAALGVIAIGVVAAGTHLANRRLGGGPEGAFRL